MVVVVLAVLPIQMWKNLLLLLLSEKRITGIHLPERSPNPEDQPRRLPIRRTHTRTHARTHTPHTDWCWCLNFCFFFFSVLLRFLHRTLCSFVNAHSSSFPPEAGLNFFFFLFCLFASLVCLALHFLSIDHISNQITDDHSLQGVPLFYLFSLATTAAPRHCPHNFSLLLPCLLLLFLLFGD